MSVGDSVQALLVAGIALYLLGLPLTWLVPAPRHSQWLYRIALAPLVSISVAFLAAWALTLIGIRLHPGQLVVGALAAWVFLIYRHGERLRRSMSRRDGLLPAALVATAGVSWGASLIGYGLYLPNRDFKNHAYGVAEIARSRSFDAVGGIPLSPVAAGSTGGYYPLGLHALLGWALPGAESNSIGVTAAAAVLVTSISLPLAGVVLARQWVPDNRVFHVVVGFALVAFPGLASPFAIGSVVLLVGTALFTAGLTALWLWLDRPGYGTTAGLAVAGFGLFALHIAEAWGLALIAVALLPSMGRARLRAIPARVWGATAALLMATLLLALLLLGDRLTALAQGWTDIEPTEFGWAEVVLRAFLNQPGGLIVASLAWLVLVCIGGWLAVKRRLAPLPLAALMVTVALVIMASGSSIPPLLATVTAPWYGSTSRVFLMAGPPIAMLGALALVQLWRQADTQAQLSRPTRDLVPVLAVSIVLAAIAIPVVNDRRAALAASLAGAGDTPALAGLLRGELGPDETVLNFEGDGTANLFAASRVPVLSGWGDYEGDLGEGRDYSWLQESLGDLASPDVQRALDLLQVRFIAVGTTSLFWDVQIGYRISSLLTQPQLALFATGTDMVILEYAAGQS